MSAKIYIKPSGHEFLAEKNETLLEAALRSGLSLKYNCNNGTCGQCKARIVSGEIDEVFHHDYVFKEAEKLDGKILLCRCTAATDLVIEAVEAQGVDDIPNQILKTTVCKKEMCADDLMLLSLRTSRSNTLWFLAGQHATLKVDNISPRNKSIASCPCNGMILQFHIHKNLGDEFSEYVFSKLALRQQVLVEGPYGKFTLDEESTRPIIMIAYETGFAPIKSLIEHAISLDFVNPICFYWLASSKVPHYMDNYCRSWNDVLDNFVFLPLKSDTLPIPNDEIKAIARCIWNENDESQMDLLKLATRVVQDHPDLSQYDVYLNGPDRKIEATKAVLLRHRLPVDRLFVDRIEWF